MKTLGAWLRQVREAKGSTLKEAEAATRIRSRFLEALEAGDFAAFPGGDVQIRGFLHLYARYLDLPEDEVLTRYKSGDGGGTPSGAPVGIQPAPPPRSVASSATLGHPPVPAPRPRRTNLETLMIAGILLIILVVAAVGAVTIISRTSSEEAPATPTATTAAEAALSPTEQTTTSPLVTPTFPANPEGGVTLTLEATEHVWVQVLSDGAIVFEGMLSPEQTQTWPGQEMVIVDTGNGAGLQVTVNGQPQGTMGGRGQLCSRAWGPGGEIAVPSLAPTPP